MYSSAKHSVCFCNRVQLIISISVILLVCVAGFVQYASERVFILILYCLCLYEYLLACAHTYEFMYVFGIIVYGLYLCVYY